MKKQELLHLHGLLAEVRTYWEMKGAAFDTQDYENLGIKPTSIHKSKSDHKEAVFELANSIKIEDMEITRDYLTWVEDSRKSRSDSGNSDDLSDSEEGFVTGVEMPEDIELDGEHLEVYEELFEYGVRNGEFDRESGELELSVDSELLDSFGDVHHWVGIQYLRELEDEGYVKTKGNSPINDNSGLKVPVKEKEDSEIIEAYLTESEQMLRH